MLYKVMPEPMSGQIEDCIRVFAGARLGRGGLGTVGDEWGAVHSAGKLEHTSVANPTS